MDDSIIEEQRTLVFALFLNQHYHENISDLFDDFPDKSLKFSDLHVGKTMGGQLALLSHGASVFCWDEYESLPYHWMMGRFGVPRYFDIYKMISLEDKV